MRKRKSDAEKLATVGRVDNRFSEEARARKGLQKIHAFPVFREIPKASLPLGEIGQRIYDEWARVFFDRGRLTLFTKQWIESYALGEQSIAQLTGEGKPISGSLLMQRNRALGELQLADVDASLTPKKPEENIFASNGFAARNRAGADKGRRQGIS